MRGLEEFPRGADYRIGNVLGGFLGRAVALVGLADEGKVEVIGEFKIEAVDVVIIAAHQDVHRAFEAFERAFGVLVLVKFVEVKGRVVSDRLGVLADLFVFGFVRDLAKRHKGVHGDVPVADALDDIERLVKIAGEHEQPASPLPPAGIRIVHHPRRGHDRGIRQRVDRSPEFHHQQKIRIVPQVDQLRRIQLQAPPLRLIPRRHLHRLMLDGFSCSFSFLRYRHNCDQLLRPIVLPGCNINPAGRN